MTVVEVTENGTAKEYRLTPEQGRALVSSGVVTASPSLHEPGMWVVKAHQQVGVARVGDMEVRITPKLPIARLLFLAGYATNPKGWREDDEIALDIAEGLVPAVARFLCHHAELALRPGLLQGYHTVEETSAVLRGRLRETDQLRRRHGQAIPMEIRRDDFTVDIAENRILLAAITRLAGLPRVDPQSARRLSALRARLSGVSPLARGGLPQWQPNRLNQRYHAALRLAEVIWQATSPEHAPGSLLAGGFLFTLWKIFEDFVTVALSEALQERHGGLPSRYPCYLDNACKVRMKPDLVWQLSGRPVAVVDAKYKPQKPSGFPDADLYQVLAYCTALRLPRGHLVYALGNGDPVRHVIQQSDIEIVCHALDLELPPGELLAQVAGIADDVLMSPQAA